MLEKLFNNLNSIVKLSWRLSKTTLWLVNFVKKTLYEVMKRDGVSPTTGIESIIPCEYNVSADGSEIYYLPYDEK